MDKYEKFWDIPGSRKGSISRIDSSGNLWLFGGSGLVNFRLCRAAIRLAGRN